MRQLLSDLLALAGLGLLGYGLWQIHPPTCFVVVGSLLLSGGLYAHLRTPPRPQEADEE